MNEPGVVGDGASEIDDHATREEVLAMAISLARRLAALRPSRVEREDVRLAHALALNIVDLLEPASPLSS